MPNFPVKGDGIVQDERNIIRFQRYLYNSNYADRVLVGSSMTFRLDLNSISDKYFNLSIAAGGSLTGLQAIISSGSLPKVVIIEANNTLLTGNNKKFIDDIFNPHSLLLNKTFPILQEQNKPTTILYQMLKNKFSSDSHDTAVTPSMLAVALQDRQTEPDLNLLNEKAAELKKMVDYLSRRGVMVVFFEPPTHPDIANSASSKGVRQNLTRNFPKDKYLWLPLPNYEAYHTTDGIHLTERSARDFSITLDKQINAVLQR